MRKRTYLTVLSVLVLALASALPASAASTSLPQGDGCNGTGNLNQWYGSTVSSCAYRYIDCYWNRLHGLEHNGDGWVYGTNPTCAAGPGQALDPVLSAYSYHSLCAAGGPCSGSVYYMLTQ